MENDLNKAVIQGQASLQGPSQDQVSSKEAAQHSALDSVQGAQSTEAPKAPHKDSSALNGGAVVNSEQAPLVKSEAKVAPAAKAKAEVGSEAMAETEAGAEAETKTGPDHAAVTAVAAVAAAAPALDHSARSPSSAQSATPDPQSPAATAAIAAAATTTKAQTKAQADQAKTLEPATTTVAPAPLAAASTKTQVETETAPLAAAQSQEPVPAHKKHKGELAESLSDELKTLNADLHASATAPANLKPKRGVASAYLASLNQSPLQQGARDARTVSESQVAKLNSPSLKKLNQAMQTGSWEHGDAAAPASAPVSTLQPHVGAVETPVHFAIPEDSLFEPLYGADHSQDSATAEAGSKEPSAVEIFRSLSNNKAVFNEQAEPYSPYRSMGDISPQDSPMDSPNKPAWAENVPPHQGSELAEPQTQLSPQIRAFAGEALANADAANAVLPQSAPRAQQTLGAKSTPGAQQPPIAPTAHFAPGVNFGASPLGNKAPAGLASEPYPQQATVHGVKVAPNDAPAISLTPTPPLLEVMGEEALSSLQQAALAKAQSVQNVFTSTGEAIADANVNSARTTSLGMSMPEMAQTVGQPMTGNLDMSDVAGHDVSGVLREMHGAGTTLLAQASFTQPTAAAPALGASALSVDPSAMTNPATALGSLSSLGMGEASGVLSAALANQANQGGMAGGMANGMANGIANGIASGMVGVPAAAAGMLTGNNMAGGTPSHMADGLGQGLGNAAHLAQATEADMRHHAVCKGGVFSNGLVQDIAPASDLYFNNGNRIIRKAVIVSKVYHRPVGGAIVEVAKLLNNLGVEAYTDQSTAIGFNIDGVPVLSRRGMKETDLIIVVGGDGSVLGASRSLVDLQVPVLGINRGHLGLLTDISPSNIEDALSKVVSGNYSTENRMMIDVRVMRRDEEGSEEMIGQSLALNETVIHSGILAHMIVCRVTINGRYMYTLRSDGIIVGTPTGSTAYSLSAGGPIIEPHLDVLCLVPMFPQSLNCSPIILPGKSCVEIEFEVKDSMPEWVNVNCDGQVTIRADTKCVVNIRQHPNQLQLIHPAGYDYYSVLRQKLGWGQSLV